MVIILFIDHPLADVAESELIPILIIILPRMMMKLTDWLNLGKFILIAFKNSDY